jgi:hypothetical protein
MNDLACALSRTFKHIALENDEEKHLVVKVQFTSGKTLQIKYPLNEGVQRSRDAATDSAAAQATSDTIPRTGPLTPWPTQGLSSQQVERLNAIRSQHSEVIGPHPGPDLPFRQPKS